MARRRPAGQDTRQRILDVALREFGARGYASVTVEEIATAAGMTKGAVYYWFADKDDLGRELQHELYSRLSTLGQRAMDPHGNTVSNMQRAFDAYLEALGDLGEARFFLRDAWTIPVLEESDRRDHEQAAQEIREVLTAAMARGEMVQLDPDALARVLLGIWAEATLHVLRHGQRSPTEEVVQHFVDSLRAAGQTPSREA